MAKRGGSEQEVFWLENTLKPALLPAFQSKNPATLVLPFIEGLYVHVSMEFLKQPTKPPDNAGFTNKYAKVLRSRLHKGDSAEDIAEEEDVSVDVVRSLLPHVVISDFNCFISSKKTATATDEDEKCGVHVEYSGGFNFNNEFHQRFGLDINPDYELFFACTQYQGRRFTDFLFCIFFYTLKLHSQTIHIRDYIIWGNDKASYETGKHIAVELLKKMPSSKQPTDNNNYIGNYDAKQYEIYRQNAEKTKIFYYERFGFTYPAKMNLLGLRGWQPITYRFIQEDLVFYLDLKTLSMSDLLSVARKIEFRDRRPQ